MTEKETISLQDAADRLGVHYMTAYRYVRLGKLPAFKQANTWHVNPDDVEALMRPETASSVPDWPLRLEERLVAGDEPGAWAIIETTMAAGHAPVDVYVKGLAPALRSIGERWESGAITVADEHRASRIVSRLIGRISPRFATRGRRRGTIVLGSPAGDAHYLGGSMIADLLRLEHFHVDELGADTPASSFVDAVLGASDATAVAISAFKPDNDSVIQTTIAEIKQAASVPVFVGGHAIKNAAHAERLGADGYATDAGDVVQLFVNAFDG